jgi:uncharacterized membrane protein YeiH
VSINPIIFQLFDFIGVAVFVIFGALVAARSNRDIVAFVFFAALTGLGGGTLRDLLLDAPVFWIEDQRYILVAVLMAPLVWNPA